MDRSLKAALSRFEVSMYGVSAALDELVDLSNVEFEDVSDEFTPAIKDYFKKIKYARKLLRGLEDHLEQHLMFAKEAERNVRAGEVPFDNPDVF